MFRLKMPSYREFERNLEVWMAQPPKSISVLRYVLPMMALGGALGIIALTASVTTFSRVLLAVLAVTLYVAVIIIIAKCLPVPDE